MTHIKLLFKGCVKSSTSTILSKEVSAMVKKLCGVKHLDPQWLIRAKNDPCGALPQRLGTKCPLFHLEILRLNSFISFSNCF